MDALKVYEVLKRYRSMGLSENRRRPLPPELRTLSNVTSLKDEDIFATLSFMEADLYSIGAHTPLSFPHERIKPERRHILRHSLYVLFTMRDLLRDGRREKFFRWFGFLSGAIVFLYVSNGDLFWIKRKDVQDGFICPLLDTIDDHLARGMLEEAFVFLGAAQALLWCVGAYSIAELKWHNMPAE